jgi:DNA-binding MarR family transcriptional regulator
MTELRTVFDDLVRFETIVWNQIDAGLQSECDVTLSHLNLMLVIDATPNCRVLDIVDALAITVGGASQAVDRLEKAGRCARRTHPDDRRSSIVELTEQGEAALASAGPVFDRELGRLLAEPLAPGRLSEFAHTLELLRRAIAEPT